MILRLRIFFFGVAILFVFTCRNAGALEAVSPSLLDRGYSEMYNVNFVAAHQSFDTYIAAHPDDPMGPVSDAAAYLFSELDRLGVLDLRLFSDDSRFEHRKRPIPDPKVEGEFQVRIREAQQLAERVRAKNPRDSSALLASTLADGLESDYEALILKNDFASLHYSNQATQLAGETLAVDPECYDAYLAEGIENYLLGIKPAPVRWILSLTGAQTDAGTGVRELRLAAAKGHYLAPFARLLLAVADLRAKDYAGARKLLSGLSKEFPANRLYSREYDRIADK